MLTINNHLKNLIKNQLIKTLEDQIRMNQKNIQIFSLLVVLAAFSIGCASVNSKLYVANELKKINSWSLIFAYESGSVEQKQKSSGDTELTVVNNGQSPVDLQLRDDIFYLLKDEYNIPVTKKTAESTGVIQIHPIHFKSGGFKQVTVTFYKIKSDDTLARLKITNGDRNATFKDDDSFAKYSARAIAKAIHKN